MYHQRKATGRRTEFGNLSEQAIIDGFRRGDASMYELMAYEDMRMSKTEAHGVENIVLPPNW